jgi:hypothetical protein
MQYCGFSVSKDRSELCSRDNLVFDWLGEILKTGKVTMGITAETGSYE